MTAIPKSKGANHETEIRRVTIAGLAVNLFLSAIKFIAGTVGNSQAVVADAVHSLSDTITDFSILLGVRYWSKPPDDFHPHGHQRIEALITTMIGLLLAFVAFGIAYNALSTIHEPHASPGVIALAAALVSIFSNELLYRWTVSVGNRIDSAALVANAWHHRSDGFSSIPAALAVAGAVLVPRWTFLDHLGAMLVSVFILYAAWGIIRPSLEQLIDTGASPEMCAKIEEIAIATKGVDHVHAIRTRFIGSKLQVDLHIHVDGEMSVRRGHDISEDVKRRLIMEGPKVVDVVVHLEPYGDGT